jgi:hypothetical protein
MRYLAGPHISLCPSDNELVEMMDHTSDRFVWTSEAQEALDKLKELLTKAPFLAKWALECHTRFLRTKPNA